MATLRLPMLAQLAPFSFSVELDGEFYGFALRWNRRDGHWYANFLKDEVVALGNVKVVHSADLLAQFGHMRVDGRLPPGTFRILDVTGAQRDPDTDTLGTEVLMLYDEAV